MGHSAACKARISELFMIDYDDKQAIRERKNMAKKRKAIVVPMNGFGPATEGHDTLVPTQLEADMICGEVLEAEDSGGASSSAAGSGIRDPPPVEQPTHEDETTALVSLPKEPEYMPSMGSCLAAAATVAGVATGCIFMPQKKES